MSSDLQNRNTAAMISATKRFSEEVAELRGMVKAQNDKIHTLVKEVEQLKKQAIMDKVNAQVAKTGHGGTV